MIHMAGNIAAVDPGRDKCGIAILRADCAICMQRVIATKQLIEILGEALRDYGFSRIVQGNGTTSKQAAERLRHAFPQIPLEIIDEYKTTEMARRAYWEANPPRGWRRLLPVSMQVPPVPVDDYVAIILARRCLANGLKNSKNPSE